MVRLLKQWLSGEKGQALSIVLCLLAIGGLTMAVSLNYATTSLKGSRIVEEKMAGVYAAGAGVEQALWSLGGGGTPPEQLPQNINQMAVGIQTVNKGTFTLYFGQLSTLEEQYWKINVNGNISWVEGNRYRYQITVTQTAETGQPIHLEEVGARLPVGYHYEDDSTTRSDIVSPPPAHDPEITPDDQGAELLNWLWKEWAPDPPRPVLDEVGDTYTQTFYITGTGSLSGAYAWAEGDPSVIGVVGEITGTRYKITATATRPEGSRTTAEIVSNVIIQDDGTISILSWQITN